MRGLTDIQYELLVDGDCSCTARAGRGSKGRYFTPTEEANLEELEERRFVHWCECGCGALHPEVTSLGRDARHIHEWLRSEAEK